MHEWRTRHSRSQLPNKKEKGPVGPRKEEEEDKLESFFGHMYEFHNPVQVAPAFVPAELPARYAIAFVPASVSAPVAVSTSATVPASSPASPSTDYSIVSSANFDVPPPSASVSTTATVYSVVSSANFAVPLSTPTSCIAPTQ